jgi:hypothetical protein
MGAPPRGELEAGKYEPAARCAQGSYLRSLRGQQTAERTEL